MLNKVDESVLQVEGQINQSDKIVSQAKGGINSLGKEQLPGQDCGCTNSGDGGVGDRSAVCDCFVGKSGGDDFQGEKHQVQLTQTFMMATFNRSISDVVSRSRIPNITTHSFLRT
ncbi:hypothetical protein BgiBS90_036611 [Biomphalaria glabrata]|nr:hypothetical protein BgiBS90_036611 [Biomphalaria glabrata]